MKNLSILTQWLNNNGLKSYANSVFKIDNFYKVAISKEEVNKMKEWFNDDYSKLSFNDLFKGKLRVAIPFSSDKERKILLIVEFLKNNGWLPSESEGTFRVKNVKQKLRRLDTNEEYDVNVVVPDLKIKKEESVVIPSGPDKGRKTVRKQESSIYKVLSNPRINAPSWMAEWWQQNQAEYAKDYNWKQIETAFRTSYLDSEYSLIISRDPIDVLRMSDYNNIRSCHSEGGSYFHCAINEAKGHGIIAYLVKTDDLNNLLNKRYDNLLTKVLVSDGESDVDSNETEKARTMEIGDLDKKEIFSDPKRKIDGIVPSARVRLRKYVLDGSGVEFAAPESRTYGPHPPGFINEVRRWAWENQKHLFEDDGDIYVPEKNELKMYGGSYRDTSDGEILNNFFESGGIETKFRGDVESENEEDERYNIWSAEVEQYLTVANNKFKHMSAYAEVDQDGDNIFIEASAFLNIRIPLNGWDIVNRYLKPGQGLKNILFDEDDKYLMSFMDHDNLTGVTSILDEEKKELSLTFVFNCEDCENPDDVETFFTTMLGVDEMYDIYFGKIIRSFVEEGFIAPNEFEKMRINLKDIKFKNLEVDFKEDVNKIYISSRENIYPEEVYVSRDIERSLSTYVDSMSLRFKLYNILNAKISTQRGLGILKDETSLILESINDILRKSYDYFRNQVTFDFYKSDNELLQEYPPLIDYFSVALSISGDMPFTLDTQFTVIISGITSDDQILIIQDFLKKLDQYNDFIFEKINESIKSKLDKNKRENILLRRDLYSGKLSLPIINEFKNIKHNKDLKRLALWIEENWDNFSNAEKEVAHYKYLVPISKGHDVFTYKEGDKLPSLWRYNTPINTNSSLSSMADIIID